MEGQTAQHIALKCVNALEILPENTPSIKHLVDGKFYSCLLTILKHHDVKHSNLLSMIPDLEALIKEHFAGPNLVNFEDVASGSQMELTKLTVLLLYITILTEAKLRSRLVSSPLMDQSAQVKVKYLFESIQKRGSGMGTKFLDILCTEKLDNKSSGVWQTPVSSSIFWGSPNSYSNSPKVASASPLRDLVQSPPFRLQRLLNAKTREVKQLNQQIHNMENDKQEMEMNLEFSHKKISKLKDELSKLQNELKDLRKYHDEEENKMMAGDELVQQQLHRLGQESSLFRRENASLQQTVNQMHENNDELTTKNESLNKRLLLVLAERDRLQEEMSTLYLAKLENENIIESQAFDLKEMKIQLEELRQHLLEFKPGNRTIEESFEGGSPINFTDYSSPSHSTTSEENLGEAVVDKILFETREQLNHLQEQHAALQEKLNETTFSRDQLLAQVESVTTENENLIYELGEVRETYTQLYDVHTQVSNEHRNTLQLLKDAQIKNQKAEAEHQRMENEAQQTHITVSSLKAELSQFVDQLSECSSQLKDLEHQLEQSRHEIQVTSATLERESKARVSLEEEFSAKESKMNEDFQQQIKSHTEEYELQVKELHRNLSILTGEQERLTQEKTSLTLEIQNLKASHVSAKKKMEIDLEEMTNKNASLSMQIQMKCEAITDIQQEMENKLKALHEEKTNLEEKIQMENEESLKLKCDMEIKVEQMTVEKAILTEEILLKERAYASLTEDMEQSQKIYSDEKVRFDMEMKAKEETLITLRNEKEKASEIHATELSCLNEINKTKEEDFMKLKKEMGESLEDLMETKTTLSKELQLKEESYAALKQKMEDNIAEFAYEKNELKNAVQQKESAYNLLQLKMQKDDDKLNCEKTVLVNEIQAKEGDISSLKKEYELAIKSHAQEKSLLTEAIKGKEEALKASQEIIDTLTSDVKVRNEEYSALQQQLEVIRAGHEKEKSTLLQKIETKESFYTSGEQEMKNTVEMLCGEKATLEKTIQEKGDTISSLQDQLQESADKFSSEKAVISQELNSKLLELSHLQEEIRNRRYDQSSSVKLLTEKLEKISSEYEAQKKSDSNLRGEIEALREEISGKVVEHNTIVSENQIAMASKTKHFDSVLSEKDVIIKTIEKQKEEIIQMYESKISELEVTLAEKYEYIDFIEQEKESLKKSKENENISIKELHTAKLELEGLQRGREEQTQSNDKIISELQASLTEKMNSLTAIKEECEQSQLTHKAQMDEREAEIAGLRSALLEKEEFKIKYAVLREQMDSVEVEKSLYEAKVAEVTVMVEKMEEEHMAMLDHLKIEAERQQTKFDADVSALKDKLKSAQEEVKKHLLHIQNLEAKLIDKEQGLTAAREEVMQVERESEKSSRSLAEELKAMKEKFRSEKKAVADRMTKSYRTEVEKLMVQIEEHEQVSKEKKIIFQKYEAAKKKLTEVFAKLDETKTINEDYEKQMTKYKELVTKLQSNLQKEHSKQNEMLSRISELEGKYQPLKEKLHETENTVRRIGNEKRSLEVQLLHAEAQMKEIKKQWECESFGHKDIVLTRPSSSSCEDDWNVDDSTQELLPSKSSKGIRKTMLRAASAETVFRKPSNRTSHAEKKQTCASVTQTTGTSEKRKTLQPSETYVSDKSLGRSVPRDMLFNCEDEEELFSNKYLLDMKVGHCNPMSDANWKRLSELQRRNSLYPPHMRSAYPAEMQFRPPQDFEDDKLREGCAVEDRHLLNLTRATENLGLDSPAFNLRKRKSLSASECSLGSSGGRKTKRLSTSYSRPGPPTPGRKSLSRIDKENRRASSASDISLSSMPYHERKTSPQSTYSGGSPISTRLRHGRSKHSSLAVSSPSTRSPGNVTVVSKKGSTPRGRRGMTPSSLRKILSKGKSPWRKLDNEQETPKVLGDSTGSSGSAKLRIFRRPFGSRNYSVLSASLRSQENPNDLNDSSTASIGHSNPTISEKKPRGRR